MVDVVIKYYLGSTCIKQEINDLNIDAGVDVRKTAAIYIEDCADNVNIKILLDEKEVKTLIKELLKVLEE